jgi:alpha-beta hydrolase superfamily lysophospholipase
MSTHTLQERTMTTWDGTELFYRAWLPEGTYDRALVLFHRGHEHSGRLLSLVEGLDLQDFAIFSWDARGNGQSPGERDDAESFSVYVRDADCFVRFLAEEYSIPVSSMGVIANSVGGVIAATWVHDYAPPIRALVLAAPAFRIKLYVPLAIPGLRLAQRLGVMKYVKSYVKSRVLTHDREEQQRFNDDPLITNSISTRILLGVHDTATRVVEDAGAIRVPTLLLMAGSDWVVKTAPQKEFFDGLSSPKKEIEYYPDFYHAIYHETERSRPLTRTREFLLERFADSTTPEPLLHADIEGYTKEEYDRLQQPSLNPIFPLARFGMKTLGRLSAGIRLGLRDGFDSGVTLDCVYRNQPEGTLLIGKLIDYFYLNSIGWVGIRARKVNLEELLRKYVRKQHEAGGTVQLMDIAAGPGRYVLDVIEELPDIPIRALLQDSKEVNVTAGRELAAARGLQSVTYQQGDAFDRKHLAQTTPPPTIAIVSGLYELFPANAPVRDSLHGLSDAMAPGSYLIYTDQPWHPQVEMIARTLTNREGEPWIMRRRTQEEMDDLVREAGFEKLEMRIDDYGIFTVSVARKR